MKITVIGTGYVGLVTGTCLSEVSNEVLCLDMDPDKIALREGGGIPICEPGLGDMVQRNAAAGRLHFTTDAQRAAHFGTIQFIAVGTPPDEDGSADMQYVLSAARNIGRYMNGYKVVVDKSTVPVGTADAVKKAIEEALALRAVATPFSVVSNPEFLNEGAAIDDYMHPDRTLIIVTECKEFKSPDFDTIKSKLRFPVIFDGRNLYDPKLIRSMGIGYMAIGR